MSAFGPESAIGLQHRNPPFAVTNPQSAIRNPQSSFRNPQSAFIRQQALSRNSGSQWLT